MSLLKPCGGCSCFFLCCSVQGPCPIVSWKLVPRDILGCHEKTRVFQRQFRLSLIFPRRPGHIPTNSGRKGHFFPTKAGPYSNEPGPKGQGIGKMSLSARVRWNMARPSLEDGPCGPGSLQHVQAFVKKWTFCGPGSLVYVQAFVGK